MIVYVAKNLLCVNFGVGGFIIWRFVTSWGNFTSEYLIRLGSISDNPALLIANREIFVKLNGIAKDNADSISN